MGMQWPDGDDNNPPFFQIYEQMSQLKRGQTPFGVKGSDPFGLAAGEYGDIEGLPDTDLVR